MANSPILATTYVTLAKAEVVNSGVTEWDAASENEQNAALSYGRQYIDSRYICTAFDEDDAPDDVQMVNSLFAVEYLKGTLFSEHDTNIKQESVKAGAVASSTTFQRGGGTSTIDPFPAISSIFYGVCKIKGKAMSNVDTVRS